MAGSGFTRQMVDTIRNNRNLLRKKSMFKKERSFLGLKSEDIKLTDTKVESRKLSRTELRRIKEKTLKEARKDAMWSIIITGVLIIPIVLVFSIWMNNNQNDHILQKQLTQEEIIEKNRDEYVFLIEDGDQWIRKNRLNNALYRYKQALALFPDAYEANHRLAMLYSYSCANDKKHCKEAEVFAAKLEKLFPNKANITDLKVTLTTTK